MRSAKVKDLPPPRDMWECAVGLAVLDKAIGGMSHSMVRLADGTSQYMYDHGSGDSLTIWFLPKGGTLLVGFDHESRISPYASGQIREGLLHGLPRAMQDLLVEGEDLFPATFAPGGPEREVRELTFAAWHEGAWTCGNATYDADDGSGWLMSCFGLDHWLEAHGRAGRDYVAICDHEPIDDDDLRELFPSCDVAAVRELMRVLEYGKSAR